MSRLSEFTRSLPKPVRRFAEAVQPQRRSHAVRSIAELALLGVAIYGVVLALPDVKRYIRMRNM